jgi:hypothetical protein
MSGRFLIHGILLTIAVFSILNGLLIWKSGHLRHPFDRDRQIEGPAARITATGLLIVGVLCLLAMLNLPDLASL